MNLIFTIDVYIIFSLCLSILNKGLIRYALFGMFILLVCIRILIILDINKSKKMSLEDVKREMPEIYYKYYATDEEKKTDFVIKMNEAIKENIIKSHKSQLEIFIEDHPDLIKNIIVSIIYLILIFVLFSIFMRYLR